ncbi:MAG: helix-turn-helix transcriptional regulator [Veillonellales bacterium]
MVEKNNQMNTLGERLQFLRKLSNVTQKIIYEATGISQSNLSKYERNITQPTADAIAAICRFYNVSADWLLFGIEQKNFVVTNDPELSHMLFLLYKMMQGDKETRCWAKKQFEYCFKPFIEEESDRFKKESASPTRSE